MQFDQIFLLLPPYRKSMTILIKVRAIIWVSDVVGHLHFVLDFFAR